MSTLQWADKEFKVAVLNMFKHFKENKYIEKRDEKISISICIKSTKGNHFKFKIKYKLNLL